VVKVFKSVGAVRVYNPWNAVWAALGIGLLLVGIGFGIGWIANNDNGGSSSSTSSSAPAVSDAAGRQAAYQNGLAAGRRQGVAAAAKKAKPAPAVAPKTGSSFKSGNSYTLNGIKSGGAYFVQVGPGGQGLRIGPHVSAKAGQTYWLCGNRICYSAR
jgi:hypothetical protein